MTVPSPWHTSQRPPGILKEKCPAVYPRRVRLRRRCKRLTDQIERLDVRDGIRPRSPPDGRLVDEQTSVSSSDRSMRRHCSFSLRSASSATDSLPQARRERLVNDLMHQRRFTRSRYARHSDHHVERNLDINVLKIVRPGPDHLQHPLRMRLAAPRQICDRLLPFQVPRCERRCAIA